MVDSTPNKKPALLWTCQRHFRQTLTSVGPAFASGAGLARRVQEACERRPRLLSEPPATRRQGFYRSLAVTALLVMSGNSLAAPWIDPGDQQTRHHLLNLVDSGAIDLPVSTWPLMWSSVKSELDTLKPAFLNDSQQWSYLYLKHELRKAMSGTSFDKHLHFSNAPDTLGGFATDSREKQTATISFSYQGHRLASRLSPSWSTNAMDGKEFRLDGSFVSYLIGNWAVGLGAIDRWWGPGWESSMILTHSARPVPGVFLQRNHPTAPESRWLSWIGPWQLTTFMGQLESDRVIDSPYLWGMRLNFRPLQSLEVGLSRTAIWGGDGRPTDLSTFYDMLRGDDNRTLAEREDGISDEAGNQLAGLDLRWGQSIGVVRAALYGQMIGEDEAGGLPSRYIGMAGAEINARISGVDTRVSLEAQNSTVNFYDSNRKAGNIAYEHSIYKTGYRYRGRPLGASTDNDTRATTLRTQLHFQNGNSVTVGYSNLDINQDNSGRHYYAMERLQTRKTTIEFRAPVSSRTAIQVGLYHYSEPIIFNEQEITSGASLDIFLHW